MASVTSIGNTRDEKAIWSLLETVTDPEIPVLTVVDLGVVRDVRVDGADVEVTITPTYSGCPAMNLIEHEIRETLHRNGWPTARVRTVLSPAWTTDWLSDAGREKLRTFGIAPPERQTTPQTSKRIAALMGDAPDVPCPRCGSLDTKMVSAFGSTPCKAHYKCNACLEPFDYFKCL